MINQKNAPLISRLLARFGLYKLKNSDEAITIIIEHNYDRSISINRIQNTPVENVVYILKKIIENNG